MAWHWPATAIWPCSRSLPPAKPGEQDLSRGQVVLAEEGAFWILAAGELRKLRFGINNADGVRLVPYGDPIPVGEPLHAPQVNASRRYVRRGDSRRHDLPGNGRELR